MQEELAFVMQTLSTVSEWLLFLFGTRTGWLILGACLLLYMLVKIVRSLVQAAQLSMAAGQGFNGLNVLFTLFDTVSSLFARLLVHLPALALVALVGISVISINETIQRLEQSTAARERIQELQTVLKNLQRSVKVADIRILSTQGDITKMQIDFYDPAQSSVPREQRELSIPGTDIYFDTIVLNFDYSEIAAGRRVNIAIPYRIFSNKVAQLDGIPLNAVDGEGIPYIFNRAEDDVYGISPDAYRERLQELLDLIKTEESARSAGIVRSVYGSAVHKRVSPGDRLEVRIEQSGGLTVKDRFVF